MSIVHSFAKGVLRYHQCPVLKELKPEEIKITVPAVFSAWIEVLLFAPLWLEISDANMIFFQLAFLVSNPMAETQSHL